MACHSFNTFPSVFAGWGYFFSIIIEALPFVLIGSIISGILRSISPERVYRFLPKNKFVGSFGTFIDYLSFCECGIVPIINRFLEKFQVIRYLSVTAFVINPIVLPLQPTSLWEFCQDGPLPRPWFPYWSQRF